MHLKGDPYEIQNKQHTENKRFSLIHSVCGTMKKTQYPPAPSIALTES